jgi:hypothetical protein
MPDRSAGQAAGAPDRGRQDRWPSQGAGLAARLRPGVGSSRGLPPLDPPVAQGDRPVPGARLNRASGALRSSHTAPDGLRPAGGTSPTSHRRVGTAACCGRTGPHGGGPSERTAGPYPLKRQFGRVAFGPVMRGWWPPVPRRRATRKCASARAPVSDPTDEGVPYSQRPRRLRKARLSVDRARPGQKSSGSASAIASKLRARVRFSSPALVEAPGQQPGAGGDARRLSRQKFDRAAESTPDESRPTKHFRKRAGDMAASRTNTVPIQIRSPRVQFASMSHRQ